MKDLGVILLRARAGGGGRRCVLVGGGGVWVRFLISILERNFTPLFDGRDARIGYHMGEFPRDSFGRR